MDQEQHSLHDVVVLLDGYLGLRIGDSCSLMGYACSRSL